MLVTGACVTVSVMALAIAFGAESVNYGFSRADSDSVLVKNVLLHFFQKSTAHMNESAAANALKMKMLVTFGILYILIAGATTLVDYEFFDNALLTELVKCAIYRRNTDLDALLLKVKGNISCTNMRTVFF